VCLSIAIVAAVPGEVAMATAPPSRCTTDICVGVWCVYVVVVVDVTVARCSSGAVALLS
jgi:hypothetical protein